MVKRRAGLRQRKRKGGKKSRVSAARKTAGKRTPAKRTPVRKAPAKKALAKKSPVKRAPAKKAPARKRAVRKAKPQKRSARRPPLPTRAAKPAPRARRESRPRTAAAKPDRLNRERRVLEDGTLRTPPSSLDMDRHGSAVRTGLAETAQHLAEHSTMTPSIAGGDVDVNVEDAYFTGDEAPGGDNPTPDQEVVDEIGKALGVEYQDGEELRGADKVTERDTHRWELDPASSEDYRDRKK